MRLCVFVFLWLKEHALFGQREPANYMFLCVLIFGLRLVLKDQAIGFFFHFIIFCLLERTCRFSGFMFSGFMSVFWLEDHVLLFCCFVVLLFCFLYPCFVSQRPYVIC